MRYLLLAVLALCLTSNVFAQESTSFQEKWEEANILMEDKLYDLALPIWLKILETDKENPNLNYKVGYCYFHAHNHREKAEPYLERAIKDATKNYDPFTSTFKQAPVESYYYLAHVYHLDYQFEKSIANFKKFQQEASRKHFLFDECDHQIMLCENAQVLMKDAKNIRVRNLGDQLNTVYPEYSPIISLDESTIYFTTRRMRADSTNQYGIDRTDGKFFEDIYVSHKDDKGVWGNPTPININKTDDHNAAINLSADGQTMFVYNDDDGNGNIYTSQLDGDQWTTPVQMGSNINTEAAETHATISSDGKSLYFVSDREGGYGGKDVYRCVKLPNGDWSMAQNVGPIINTKYDEDAPFFHPDGKAMYFSSKGHMNMGGYDIFVTYLNEDGVWTKPENFGYPINSTDDDIFFIVTPDGKRAYYSSSHEGGKGEQDLYMMELTEAIEKSLTLLKGFIVVPEGKQLPDDLKLLVTDNESGELVAQGRPIKRTGSFIFIIPPGKNYNISYEAAGKEFYNENIYVPFGSEYNEINKEILLDPVKLGQGEILVKRTLGTKQWKFAYKELNADIPAGLKINFVDDNGEILFTEVIDPQGNFPYHLLPPDRQVYLSVADNNNIDCEEIEFLLLDDDGVVVDKVQVEKGNCRFKIEEPTDSGTDNAGDAGTDAPVAGLDKALEFEQFFGYNKTDVKEKQAELAKLAANIAEAIKANKTVKVAIKASASKVPTRTFGSNKKLAKKRADKAKKALLKELKKAGIEKSAIAFDKPNAMVQGPKYKGDFKENREAYEKFQYVQIKAY